MNVLIADGRISAASLLAAELRSRDVFATLAMPLKESALIGARAKNKDVPSPLREISWNPLSWLSTDSLVFEAAKHSSLDALVLLFDVAALSPFFLDLSPEQIFLSSTVAFQTLFDAVLKRFQAKKAGRVVFMLSKKEKGADILGLNGGQYIAAASAESAFERFAEECAFVFSKTEDAALSAILIKGDFAAEGFISWAAGYIATESLKIYKNTGKWISRGGGSLSSIFQRRI